MLINTTNRSVTGICERTRCQDSICWVSNIKRSAIDIYKVNTCSFRFFLIFLFVLFTSPSHESSIVTSFRFFCISIDNTGNFFIEDSVMNVGLFGMEVFIERGSDDTVRVNGDAKFFGGFTDVGVVSVWERSYFLYPPSCEKTRRLPPFYTYFLRS